METDECDSRRPLNPRKKKFRKEKLVGKRIFKNISFRLENNKNGRKTYS